MPRKKFFRKRSGTIIKPKLKRHEQNYAGLHKKGARFKIHKETSSLSSVLTRASAGLALDTTREEPRGKITEFQI